MAQVYQNSYGDSVYDFNGQTINAKTGQLYTAPTPTSSAPAPSSAPSFAPSTGPQPVPTQSAPAPTVAPTPTSGGFVHTEQSGGQTIYFNDSGQQTTDPTDYNNAQKAQSAPQAGAGGLQLANSDPKYKGNLAGDVQNTALIPPAGYDGASSVTIGGQLYQLNGGLLIPDSSPVGNNPSQYGITDIGSHVPGGTPSAPPVSQIGNPAAPPGNTSSGGLSLPTPTAAATVGTFTTGLQSSVDTTKAALLSSYDTQIKSYQDQIDALTKQQQDLQTLQDSGMAGEQSTMLADVQQKKDALATEQQQFQENYDANQKLVDELDGLLTQGNAIVQNMQNTTGLASIMNPRIAQTMSDVAARAGVIQAVLSARNGQIGQAQNQLQATLGAITSISNDQLDYYKSVVNFYEQKQQDNQANIDTLSKDQKTYVDAKIGLLQNDVDNANKAYQMIQTAMMDPATALVYAKAGVTMNDTPQQINQKLAVQAYASEISDISNKMAAAGYSTTAIAGVTPVTITDSQGGTHNYYKQSSSSTSDGSFTLGTNQVKFDAAGNVVAKGPTSADNTAATTAATTTAAGDKLLSPAEVASLQKQGYTGVTYGMTQNQAAQVAKTQTGATSTPQPSGYPTVALQPGSTDTANVTKLQNWLVANGYMTQADMNTGPGIYGPKTTAAVAALQSKLGVDNSSGVGYYGPKTMAALTGTGTAPTPTSSSSTTAPKDYSFASAGDKSKVLTWVAANPNAGVDQTKLKTDSAYFYWVLSQIGTGSQAP